MLTSDANRALCGKTSGPLGSGLGVDAGRGRGEQMRAQEVTFLSLVQGEKQFQVPLYQRTYSWKDSDQLPQLWRDLREQSEALAEASERPAHFIGSVVLAPSPGLQASGVQRWLVVDGQQRLTTLMLAGDRSCSGPHSPTLQATPVECTGQ